ncbi:hypothetical protein HOY80DRAFT_1021032 [Tuber brumale]|nr:hypothetical protein HOY80DRAFT_1021032 [Tuber brumale]
MVIHPALHPLDVALFSPLKRKWTDAVLERFQCGNHTVKRNTFWEILQQVRESGLAKNNILSGFQATGIYPLDAQKILSTLPDDDSYKSTSLEPTSRSQDPPLFYPYTPKTERESPQLALIGENSIHRNTPSSRNTRTAIRLLARSTSYYYSTLNLQDETKRIKQQYWIEKRVNCGRNKGRKRISVDNTAISAGDVSTETKMVEICGKLELQRKRETKREGRGRYKSVVQLEDELKESEDEGVLDNAGVDGPEAREYEVGEDEAGEDEAGTCGARADWGVDGQENVVGDDV